MSSSNQKNEHDNSLDAKIEEVKHDLDDLKISAPSDPTGDFSHRISTTVDEMVKGIKQTKDFISKERQKDLQEKRGSKIPERLQRVFETLKKKIFEDAASMEAFEVSFHNLDQVQLKIFFLFLLIFPESAIIMRRPLIYLWIGEGLITKEQEGEKIFKSLLKLGLITPYGNGKSSHVNKCQIHPWIRYALILLTKKAKLFEFDLRGNLSSSVESSSQRTSLVLGCKSLYSKYLRTIFNVNESLIEVEVDSLTKNLAVLQLGRWNPCPITNHIEVKSEKFLSRLLMNQKFLKYLSLRGISKITSLPKSVLELVSLEILDLNSCHSLKILPPNFSSLRKLTHLDISRCFLLEKMPEGIDKLTSLQVLKGLVIGDGDTKNTIYKTSNLTKLVKLKRLSVYIGNERVIEDVEANRLKELESLQSLKISWIQIPKEKQALSFPPFLEKLKLENIPEEKPEWLSPEGLKNLKKLYLLGGKFSSLVVDVKAEAKWKVESLHIMYLKNLKMGFVGLRKLFPSLQYLKMESNYGSERCDPNLRSYVDVDEWSKEADE